MTTLYFLGGLVFIAGLAMWLALREARRGGRAEATADNLAKGQEAEHVRRDVETVVTAADPAERSELRSKWSRD